MGRLRTVVQLVALAVFVGLVWATALPSASGLRTLLLRLDPLAALAVALSPGRSLDLLRWFWPALLLAGLTMVFGRFFCGWLCPLGTCVEACSRRTAATDQPVLARIKYLLLAFVLGAALIAFQPLLLLDPLCLFTRTVVTALIPALTMAHNGLVAITEPLRAWLGWHWDPVAVQPFRLGLLWGVLVVGLLTLGAVQARFWCRYLCPLGALLALVGRYGLWRRQVATDCPGCAVCATDCPMGAIPADQPEVTHQAECIQCYECTRRAPCATRVGLTLNLQPLDTRVDVGRRQFLGALAAGAAAGWLARAGCDRRVWLGRLLRPPGALVRDLRGRVMGLKSETDFRAQCIRCGQCLRACPTGGLQPAVTEAGLDGFGTPVLVPRTGWCEQNCVACGQACPSGALQPFTVAEKPEIKLGLATLHPAQCLCWQEGGEYRECMVCKECCSYGAIVLRPAGGGQVRPYVIDHKCVGCGICEGACPVGPEAAIVVNRRGTAHGL